MKKWLVVFLIFVIVIVSSVYIFIPSSLNISAVSLIGCTQTAAYRVLSDTSSWKKWWPSALHSKRGEKFIYKNAYYTISEILQNTFKLSIEGNKSSVASILYLLPLARDSMAMEWQCKLSTGSNPLKRILTYREAVQIKNNMDEILVHLKQFLQVPENIYGITIRESSTIDTLLLATKKVFPVYPSTDEIYELINRLKSYITINGSVITGYPMVNITLVGKEQFECMVAVPANKGFKTEANFFFRRMVPGNFLTTVVHGGEFTVANAQKQMQLFINDYQKTSMAISFQSLITDRSVERDSSKWETKLYGPVMK